MKRPLFIAITTTNFGAPLAPLGGEGIEDIEGEKKEKVARNKNVVTSVL